MTKVNVDVLAVAIEEVKALEVEVNGLEVSWIESSDEWVVNYNSNIIIDGLAEDEANMYHDELSAYTAQAVQIELKEYSYEYSMENNSNESFTEIALDRMIEDSWTSDFDTVAHEVADSATPIANYEIWEVASNNYESIEENIEEGLVIIDGNLTQNFMSSIAYTLNSAIEQNKEEVLYNYIAYRVNKMLVKMKITDEGIIEALEDEIETYADEAENAYSEFDYMDDEMFEQLEDIIKSYVAAKDMGESLGNQDYENIGDVTVTEGAVFVKRDETTNNSYYVVRVCGNEFDGFHIENMCVDLNDTWFDKKEVLNYYGVNIDTDEYSGYELMNALISYYNCEEFNGNVIDCKTAIDLCGALRELGVNVVWSVEQNEMQF